MSANRPGGVSGIGNTAQRRYGRIPMPPYGTTPMTAKGNNGVIEQLRAIRARLGKIERELAHVRHRVSSMECHVARLQSDVANIHRRLDGQGERLDRIEHRLELVD